jgi:hypothetical protein
MNREPNSPDKGLDTRSYLLLVGAGLTILLIAVMTIVVHVSHSRTVLRNVTKPKTTSAASPQ